MTTNAMEPPPMPSILLRGEWSLGKVVDIDWRWSVQGNTYLGRLLAGLDSDDVDFGMLPPHFKKGRENEHISEAMQLYFGPIMICGMTSAPLRVCCTYFLLVWYGKAISW